MSATDTTSAGGVDSLDWGTRVTAGGVTYELWSDGWRQRYSDGTTCGVGWRPVGTILSRLAYAEARAERLAAVASAAKHVHGALARGAWGHAGPSRDACAALAAVYVPALGDVLADLHATDAPHAAPEAS